jgi:hypothetical protein
VARVIVVWLGVWVMARVDSDAFFSVCIHGWNSSINTEGPGFGLRAGYVGQGA